MSRPRNPSFVVPSFAPNTNYPAGANSWNSNPTKVLPPGATSVGFTPGQGNAAQYYNYLFNAAYATDDAAKAAIDATLNYVGQGPALNITLGPTVALMHAAWNPIRRSWLGAANGSKSVRESTNYGQTFSATNLIGALGGASFTRRICVNDIGEAVVTCANTDVYHCDASGTWAYQTPALGQAPDASNSYELAFDGTRWIAYISYGSGRQYMSSTNRTSWTARTIVSSGGSAHNLLGRVAANKTTGRTVSACLMSGFGGTVAGTSEVLATLDGGATWQNGGTYATISHGFTANQVQDLHFNAASGLFYFIVGNTAAGSKVYTSSDGISWTLVCTLASTCLRRITSVGELLLADASGTSLAYSIDRGATWRHVGYVSDNIAGSIVSSPDQFLVLSSLNVHYSHRAGLTGNVLT